MFHIKDVDLNEIFCAVC